MVKWEGSGREEVEIGRYMGRRGGKKGKEMGRWEGGEGKVDGKDGNEVGKRKIN